MLVGLFLIRRPCCGAAGLSRDDKTAYGGLHPRLFIAPSFVSISGWLCLTRRELCRARAKGPVTPLAVQVEVSLGRGGIRETNGGTLPA